MRYVASCFVSAVFGGLLVVWLTGSIPKHGVLAQERSQPKGPNRTGGPTKEDRPAATIARDPVVDLQPDEAVNVAVYDIANRCVVNITTKSTDGFFLLDVASEGTGSGSVIDNAGHILTNYHVIEDAQEVGVTLFNGKVYEATLVGADARNDVAVIKIDAPRDELFPVTFSDSSRLKVGMKVYAIGNPFGLERTMTTGIISSLNRSLQVHGSFTIRSIIQIDAAVNPGNSGGPLLDSRARLIGINTAIASRTGQNSGVGFAIPVNLVARVAAQLIQHGRVIRPEIGIQRVYVTDQGLQIERLTSGGPAERAGLRGPRVVRNRRGPFVVERVIRSSADIIVEVDGQKVETGDDLLGYIESKRAGDEIELIIIRDGKRIHVPLVLGSSDPTPKSRVP